MRKKQQRQQNKTKKKIHTIGPKKNVLLLDIQRWKEKRSSKWVIKIRKFPGATISDMYRYLITLLEKKINHVILHDGTNDVVNYEENEIVDKLLQLKSFIQEKLSTTNLMPLKPIMRVDTKQREKVVTDVNKKFIELNTGIVDNGNLDRNHLNGKELHLNGKVFYYMLRIRLMVFGNYDATKKCPKNASVKISK